MTVESMWAQLATEEARYDSLVGTAAGRSLKPGELDVWALARHAHQNCKQLRAQLDTMGDAA